MTADAPDLPEDVLEAIYRHARDCFPEECCGYLRVRGDHFEVVHCTNRQNELHALDPETFPRDASSAYHIGGAELLALARSFDSDHPATVIYHSHPEVGAYFSDEDARAARAAGYPVDYLVVDVQREEVRESRLYRSDATGQAFIEVACYPGTTGAKP